MFTHLDIILKTHIKEAKDNARPYLSFNSKNLSKEESYL